LTEQFNLSECDPENTTLKDVQFKKGALEVASKLAHNTNSYSKETS
jgi:hypothetical protein